MESSELTGHNPMFPQVFIIIVNWNGWQDTLECLESLNKLNYPSFKIIVVDNASTDGSEQKIREAYPEITVIQSHSNLGYAGGNNIGIRFALKQGVDSFWLLNNDTVVHPDALLHLVQRMQEKPNAGMCGSTLLYYDMLEKVQAYGGATYNKWLCKTKLVGQNRLATDAIDHFQVEQKLDFVSGASLLVSRSFIENIGLMNEEYFLYFEEIDWATRAKGQYCIAYAPDSIVYHKEGQSIGTHRNPKERSELSDYYGIRNRIRFTRKYYLYVLPIVYIALVVVAVQRIRRNQWGRLKLIWQAAKEA